MYLFFSLSLLSRSQVTQRVERLLHVDPSQVNISKMKVRTVAKEKCKNGQGVRRAARMEEIVSDSGTSGFAQGYVNEDLGNIKRQKRKTCDDHIETNKGRKRSRDNDSETPLETKKQPAKRGRKPKVKVAEQSFEAQKESCEESDVSEEYMPKPIVLLEDLRSVLPAEAFGGKAVSAQKIEGNISHSSPDYCADDSVPGFTLDLPVTSNKMTASSPTSPSQVIFSALSPSQDIHKIDPLHPEDKLSMAIKETVSKEDQATGNVRGRCVVCGCNYYVEPSFWVNIDTLIRPPSLMISVRWVCISLDMTPVEVSSRDQELGKVSNLN